MADAPKKLTTAEILAAARKQAGSAAPPPAAPEAPAPAAEATPAETPAAAKPAAKQAATGAKPTSTADILAAARAQAKGGAAASGGEAPAAKPAGEKPAAKPPAAGGAKPGSTADILAAARAQAKGGGTPAPSAAPAEKKTPAAKASPKAPVTTAGEGPKLSVEEMLAAVRPAKPVEEFSPIASKPAVDPKTAPPMPTKPGPVKTPGAQAKEEARRFALVALFLSPFALAWMMLSAVTAIAALATARFMLPNVLTEPPRKFKIGPPSDYDLGTVATKWVAQYGIWVVHTDQYKGKNSIYALISVCTHLGCTPSWLEGEQKFKCPCHGSGFYISGINFEGPAPRPLERAGISLAPDGMLEVDKSVKFQEEMGQWDDATSYVEIS